MAIVELDEQFALGLVMEEKLAEREMIEQLDEQFAMGLLMEEKLAEHERIVEPHLKWLRKYRDIYLTNWWRWGNVSKKILQEVCEFIRQRMDPDFPDADHLKSAVEMSIYIAKYLIHDSALYVCFYREDIKFDDPDRRLVIAGETCYRLEFISTNFN